MDAQFELEILHVSRRKLAKLLEDTATDKVLKIPAGFNNNVLWHIGHCLVSQQRLIYMRSGLPMVVSDAFVDNFKIGSSPATWKETPDVLEVKHALLNTAQQLVEDINSGLFKTYEALTTSTGITISNHLQALSYTNFHEAEHTGNLKYLLRIIG